MTAYRIVEVACDGGDGYCNAVADEVGQTFAGARAAARAEGWTHRAGQDFCPEHALPAQRLLTLVGFDHPQGTLDHRERSQRQESR